MDFNQEYNNLLKNILDSAISENQKIRMIEQFKYNIIHSKNTGKKVIKMIDGKKIKIPIKYLGKYQTVCRMMKNNQFNQILINPLPELEPIINRSTYLKEEYYQLKLKISDRRIDSNKKRQLIRRFLSDNAIAINFLKGVNEYQPPIKNDLTIKDVVGVEEKKVIPIQQVKKPKNKGRLKRNLKILIASISALVIMSSCATIYSQFQSVPSSTITTPTVVTEYQTQATTKSVTVPTQPTTSKVNKIHKETSKTPKTKFKVSKKSFFNKSFKLFKKTPIYTNMNDANNKINGQKPYFNYHTNRTIIGYGLEYQNNPILVVKVGTNNYKIKNDQHISYLTETETNEYLSKLMKKSAKIKSVLSHNKCSSQENSVEGFYNIKDIKVKKL